MRLEDRVAFISGEARGMGAAIAKLFAKEGAKVVTGDVLEEEGRKTEAEINETVGECLFVRLDVTSEAEWQQAVASTVAHFGKLDVLVNNAGTYRTGLVEEITSEQRDQDLDTNAKGALRGTKHAIPEMRKAGGGSIVNIASVSGLEGSMEASCAYHTAKAAVRLLTKSTAVQYARKGIRANSIHPGSTERMLNAHLMEDEEYRQAMFNKIPLGRQGQPEEVAYGALYLTGLRARAKFLTTEQSNYSNCLTIKCCIIYHIRKQEENKETRNGKRLHNPHRHPRPRAERECRRR